MPRKSSAAPLAADIVKVAKGAARPLGESRGRTPVEERIGLTIRLPVPVHEALRLAAFEQRCSKQSLVEAWVTDQLMKR